MKDASWMLQVFVESDRPDRKVRKWFGHLEGMSGESFTLTVYESQVEGRKNMNEYNDSQKGLQ